MIAHNQHGEQNGKMRSCFKGEDEAITYSGMQRNSPKEKHLMILGRFVQLSPMSQT